MFEFVDLSRKLSKAKYKQRLPGLRRRLLDLQRAMWQNRIGSLVLFEGWTGSGRLATIRKITQWLEPRGFRVHSTLEPRSYEAYLPWMWRFWVRLPSYGEMAIFDRSWYGRCWRDRLEGSLAEREWSQRGQDIVDFERGLAHDRYEVIKLFFHLSDEEHGRRLESLRSDPATEWRVEDWAWELRQRYREYLDGVEELIQTTDTGWAPWTVVAAHNRRWARFTVFSLLVERLENALVQRGLPLPDTELEAAPPAVADGAGEEADRDDRDDRDGSELDRAGSGGG